MKRLLYLLFVGGLWLAFAQPAKAFCYTEAGERYHVDPQLLRSISKVESGFNAGIIGYNRNKKGLVTSRDFGLMQINSTHVPQLRSMGVLQSEQDLLTKPCLNVMVGAWILARHLQVCGVTWECLGSYNAGFADDNTARRMLYARKVYADYMARR